MKRRMLRHSRAFSLLEVMVSVMILAAVAAILSPVVSSTGDVFIQTMRTRQTSERVGFALERLVRFVREIEPAEAGPTVGITVAQSDRLVLANSSGIALAGTELLLTNKDGQSAVLCTDVESFELAYIGVDGATETIATPGQTRTIRITIRADGYELRAVAFIRSGATL
jgi:prepilin-type N-terminal cleavage/methylation domain-containing protein